jgi:dipeptidyl-peptidase III
MTTWVLSMTLTSAPAQEAPTETLVDRVGSTGFLQLYAPSFKDLSLREKILAYWLSMAAIAVNPIVYDQNSVYGLREKHLLEGILQRPKGIDPEVLKKITGYTKLFWANRGNRYDFTSRKFLPEFTPQELKTAAEQALRNGAHLGPRSKLAGDLEELQRPVFDPEFQPMLTDKNPKNGEDPLVASSNNLYEGVRLSDLAGFQEAYPLNSRLVKKNGRLIEQVYRAGTGDGKIPPGLYAAELSKAIRYLALARRYAEPGQQKVLSDLIRYYQTGSPDDWRTFNRDWVENNSTVDFTNGFIEVYKDARGIKGSSQAFVTVVDENLSKLMRKFAADASYFEQREPWADPYKLANPHPPLANAVEALIQTSDFNITTIGENLPNEMEIHDQYGSKSFIFTGSTRAFAAASGARVAEEFSYTPEEAERARKYGPLVSNLITAMHEVLGHGSGKMNPQLDREPAYYIKEYYSTLEEARADLVAFWNIFDPKLIQMGAIPNLEAAREAYDSEARAALAQLHEVPTGDTIEEDHRRGTQLIVNYIRDKTGAVEPVERDGKVYLVVKDYAKMREGVGMLLAELMRIKAEGDYEGAKALISKYGIHFNAAWRDQVVERYKKLDLPSYWAGINPTLVPHYAANGRIDEVEIIYPKNIVRQQLRYTEVAGE